jgi:hypothetical protein
MIGYQSPAARIGHKYEGWQDAAVIAKKVRADFKAAQKAGEFPADIKVSVRCRKFAGGQSVDVQLSGWAKDRVSSFGEEGWRQMSPEAKEVRFHAQAIAEAYNKDESDSMVDYFRVVYYSNAEWDYNLVYGE